MADAAFGSLAVTFQLQAKVLDTDQADAIAETVRTGAFGGWLTS